MRPVLLLSCLASCLLLATVPQRPSERGPLPRPDTAGNLDIVQHTCALHVSLHSYALERPIAFGQDPEANDVKWNFCPGGTMVACVVTPNAQGEPLITGIPWPYGPK